MPELPEVETIIRSLRPALVGRRVLSVDLRWARSLARPSPRALRARLPGQEVVGLSRRGKFIDCQLTSDHLLIHLRMSGDLLLVLGGYQAGTHDRLLLGLSQDATLVFTDPRKFGRVWLLPEPQDVLAELGPEPLSEAFTPLWLHAALNSRRRQLKPLLLDQTFLAGLGNIYADEALHLARLNPLLPSDSLTSAQADALWGAIRSVLEEGIRRNGASIDWVFRGGEFQNHFRVYGRTGQPCPVCGTPIERLLVGQRGTHICPLCQPQNANIR